MIIHDFTQHQSVLQQFVAELRSAEQQIDRIRFTEHIRKIGFTLGYELSKTLPYATRDVRTPLGVKTMSLPANLPVICAVLRAGLPLQQGVRDCFVQADLAFISAYRTHQDDHAIKTIVEYLAAPELKDKIVIICDPMIASGTTLETVHEVLQTAQLAKEIHLVAVIGSREGIAHIERSFPSNTHLWIAAIDEHLSKKKYIVPGLGDAGDLSFGKKSKSLR
ncbi:uracil phosphoribosyltransferase [Croceiramulus getboli]|nr:uracil phosphoribosyltransferase [Flavobacteriaceae bacterium YJPT1-3]